MPVRGWRAWAAGAGAWAAGLGCGCGGDSGAGGEGGAKPCPPACAALAVGACQRPSCDPESGQCVVAAALDGTACDDGKVCTVDDACHAGVCSGAPNTCGV